MNKTDFAILSFIRSKNSPVDVLSVINHFYRHEKWNPTDLSARIEHLLSVRLISTKLRCEPFANTCVSITGNGVNEMDEYSTQQEDMKFLQTELTRQAAASESAALSAERIVKTAQEETNRARLEAAAARKDADKANRISVLMLIATVANVIIAAFSLFRK